MSEENVQNTPEQKPEDIFAQRAAKVQDLAAAGILPFGRRFDNVQMTADVRKNFKPEAEKQEEVTIAGRMTAFRAMGKSIFADIKDSSGRMQIYVQRDQIGEDDFKVFKKLDLGDIIGVTGEPFTTRTGELTVKVHKFTLLSKSLRPLPEKFHGLTDIEQRYRQRYLDLITNDDSRKVFMQRFAILSEIRKFLASKGFLEVETPMLQPIPGGANANPFKTKRSTARCTCVSLPNFTSSGCWSAALREYSSSTATSATKGSTAGTIPSSPCWKSIRHTATAVP